MVAAYRYVSADSHLEIDSRYWAPRVAAQHRERAPRLIRLPDGSDAWLVEGRPLREVPWDLYGGKGREQLEPFGQNYETTPGTGPPEQRLREQDLDGIDAEFLFPGVSGPALWRSIRDDDAYRAVVRGVQRLSRRGLLLRRPRPPDRSGRDPLDRRRRRHRARWSAARSLGLKGVALGIFPSGRTYPTPEDDRFWAAALRPAHAPHRPRGAGPLGPAAFDVPERRAREVVGSGSAAARGSPSRWRSSACAAP